MLGRVNHLSVEMGSFWQLSSKLSGTPTGAGGKIFTDSIAWQLYGLGLVFAPGFFSPRCCSLSSTVPCGGRLALVDGRHPKNEDSIPRWTNAKVLVAPRRWVLWRIKSYGRIWSKCLSGTLLARS